MQLSIENIGGPPKRGFDGPLISLRNGGLDWLIKAEFQLAFANSRKMTV